jgi:hypothetical protein
MASVLSGQSPPLDKKAMQDQELSSIDIDAAKLAGSIAPLLLMFHCVRPSSSSSFSIMW